MYSVAFRISQATRDKNVRSAKHVQVKIRDQGDYYLTNDQLRGFIVLHEFVHSWLQVKHDPSEEAKWDKALWEGCFKDKIVKAHK
jgi:hypothetical protein